MYLTLLFLHNMTRWAVLLSLMVALYRAFDGWRQSKRFSRTDNIIRSSTVTVAHLQLTLGLALYFTSPVVNYFTHNFSEAVHQREIRFFGMEHATLMLVAVVLLTIGSAISKKRTTDAEKFKVMAIWFSIALLLILIAIPWPFSPFTGRPYWR